MPLVRYEDLDVYKLAFALALEVHRLSLEMPKIEQFGGIGDQIRRCSKSVCANLVEGLAKQMSLADKRKFLQIATGSAEETRVWLQFSLELGYVIPETCSRLRDEYSRVAQMLFKLQTNLK